MTWSGRSGGWGCGWSSHLLDQAQEHLPIICLGLEKSLELLLLLQVQLSEGLVLALVDASEGLDDFSDEQ